MNQIEEHAKTCINAVAAGIEKMAEYAIFKHAANSFQPRPLRLCERECRDGRDGFDGRAWWFECMIDGEWRPVV